MTIEYWIKCRLPGNMRYCCLEIILLFQSTRQLKSEGTLFRRNKGRRGDAGEGSLGFHWKWKMKIIIKQFPPRVFARVRTSAIGRGRRFFVHYEPSSHKSHCRRPICSFSWFRPCLMMSCRVNKPFRRSAVWRFCSFPET